MTTERTTTDTCVAERTAYQCLAAQHGVPDHELRDLPLYQLTASIASPCGPSLPGSWLNLPAQWPLLVARLARAASSALNDNSQLYIPPGTDSATDPARRLADPSGLDGLSDIVETLASQLEQTLFRCPVAVDKVHVYRQMPSTLDRFDAGSWIWHADGHPAEFVKVLVYLSDVDENDSVFQLLWSERRNRALRVAAAPMSSDNWQSGEARSGANFDDAFVESWVDKGYRSRSITGPAGTTVLFATNCIHRGTLARTQPRDTLILRLRPAESVQMPRLQTKATVGQYTTTQAFAA